VHYKYQQVRNFVERVKPLRIKDLNRYVVMNTWFLLILIWPYLAGAQSDVLEKLNKDEFYLHEKISELKALVIKQKKIKDEELLLLLVNKDKIKVLTQDLRHHDQAVNEAKKEIDENLSKIVLTQKLSSRASFYRCLKEELSKKDFLDSHQCLKAHDFSMTELEKRQIELWDSKIKYSIDEKVSQLNEFKSDMKLIEEKISRYDVRINEAQESIQIFEGKITGNNAKKKDAVSLVQHPEYRLCNESTLTINLEEKTPFRGAQQRGPFYEITRDNQDGLGTCYANTAKNLLVALSGGMMNPSFLDLALIFKRSKKDLSDNGLDGGLACEVLDQAKLYGYCSQKWAPIERGEENIAFRGLLGAKASSLKAQADTLDLIRNFLVGVDDLRDDKSHLSKKFLTRGKEIIQKIQNNPLIKIPLPVARFEIPPEWKLHEIYPSLKVQASDTKKKFIEDYREAYKHFYPLYVSALLDKKDLNHVFDIYKKSMGPFISKYGLEKHLADFKKLYLIHAQPEFKKADFYESLNASLALVKDLSEYDSDDNEMLFRFCSSDFKPEMDFLTRLQPLLERLNELKVDPYLMVDGKGAFLDSSQIMQLAIAPACMNIKNRNKLNFEFSCEKGYDLVDNIKQSHYSDNEKLAMLRERIVLSLRQGLALGNSFPSGENISHINTIVGFRYNGKKSECEVLIRESQTGLSTWESERTIFNNIRALTEVRIK